MLLVTSADFSTAFIRKEPGDLWSWHRGHAKVPVLLQHCLPAAPLPSGTVVLFTAQHREEAVQSQCKSQLQQPHSPPLPPISFQTVTHHKKNGATLVIVATTNSEFNLLCIQLHAENWLCMWKSQWGIRLQPGWLRQCLTVSNSGYYSSLYTYCHSPGVVTKVVAFRDHTEVVLKVSPVVSMKAFSKYNSCKFSIWTAKAAWFATLWVEQRTGIPLIWGHSSGQRPMGSS